MFYCNNLLCHCYVCTDFEKGGPVAVGIVGHMANFWGKMDGLIASSILGMKTNVADGIITITERTISRVKNRLFYMS